MSTPLLLVAGTPRSGTTLAYRLIRELPGFAGPPQETHFLELILQPLMLSPGSPLEPDNLRLALVRYKSEKTACPGLDVEAIVASRPKTISELFRLVVTETSDRSEEASVLTEKTPRNLWLSRAFPDDDDVRYVLIVRDPRAVVASLMGLNWTASPSGPANRWLRDQAEARRLHRRLGRSRVLLVRYEDLLDRPTVFKERVLDLTRDVRSSGPSRGTSDAGTIFADHESRWKTRALDDPDPSRKTAWQDSLAPGACEVVEQVCGRAMVQWGYEPAKRSLVPPVRQWHTCEWLWEWSLEQRIIGVRARRVAPGSDPVSITRAWVVWKQLRERMGKLLRGDG